MLDIFNIFANIKILNFVNMNVNFRLLSAGVLFFLGHVAYAQEQESDSVKTAQIEEVVVLGYNKTATKPKDVTASVTVSAEKLENRPNVSFLNSLQGEAAGLSVSSSSGSPGSSRMDIIIRGISSLNASSDPLYVIDGMVSNSVQFRNLNPNDIEAVSILKDAQATAIYGNRGSNGVIVIRTKQGKYGSRFNVTYSGTTGVSVLPETKYNLVDAKGQLTLQKRYGQGIGSFMTDAQIANYVGPNTNWRDVFFRTGTTQSHDLSMMFGGENVNNYTSLGYFEQLGTVPSTDFKRFSLRNNLNAKSKNERFTFNSNIALGFSKRHQLFSESDGGNSGNIVQNPLWGAVLGSPLMDPDLYATGQEMFNGFGTNMNNGQTVYSLLDILRGNLPNELTETSIVTNFAATYKLTEDLSVTNKSGIDYKYATRNSARAPWAFLSLAVAIPAGIEFGGNETFTNVSEFNFNSITSLNYHKVFGEKHTFDFGVYADYLKTHYKGTTQNQDGLNPMNWVFGAGSGYVAFNTATPSLYRPTINLSKVTAGTMAYFATLDYDYDDKYGVSGTIRRDGTFRFVDDNKWGTFWSVAGRWNINNESFMENAPFDMLKLRGSYGVIGNQNVIAAAYGTNPLLVGTNLVRDTFVIGQGYNQLNSSIAEAILANPSVQWEEVSQANIGLDWRTRNRKFEGTLDVYRKETDKLYNDINYSWIVGNNPSTGGNTIKGNNGKLRNEGVELSLKYNLLNKQDYKLSLYANGAYNKGTVLEANTSTDVLRYAPGSMIGEWFLVDYVGVNQANGELLFDVNGEIVEEFDQLNDTKATGKSYLPKYTGGFGINSTVKNFFLDAHFSFQADVWRMDDLEGWLNNPSLLQRDRMSSDLLNAWTPTNTNTNVPSLTSVNASSYSDYSDRFLRDASFVRLKNVMFGYNVPKRMLGENLSSIKLYLQGENLLTFTKWQGYDPEPLFAYSGSVYPNLRAVSLGINVTF